MPLLTPRAIFVRQQVQRDSAVGTLWGTGGSACEFRDWLGDDLEYRDQPNGDLGDRLLHGFEDAFQRGATCAFALGGDVFRQVGSRPSRVAWAAQFASEWL